MKISKFSELFIWLTIVSLLIHLTFVENVVFHVIFLVFSVLTGTLIVLNVIKDEMWYQDKSKSFLIGYIILIMLSVSVSVVLGIIYCTVCWLVVCDKLTEQ